MVDAVSGPFPWVLLMFGEASHAGILVAGVEQTTTGSVAAYAGSTSIMDNFWRESRGKYVRLQLSLLLV